MRILETGITGICLFTMLMPASPDIALPDVIVFHTYVMTTTLLAETLTEAKGYLFSTYNLPCNFNDCVFKN